MGRDGPGGKWIVKSFSGTMTVPSAPHQPQSLNGAGFSIWPGLLVGDRLLQPCLTLHPQIFPGDTFFSRKGGTGSSRMNLTHEMAGCCYTETSPYFVGLWGYNGGSNNVVANRWIPRQVAKVFWSIHASKQRNASFGGSRFDYDMVWQGLDAAGRPVPGAAETVLVETRASKMKNGTTRPDAGKSYGLQINNEIFSGLPFRAPRRYDEIAVELWPFLPSSNVYFTNLSVVIANGGGVNDHSPVPPHPVPFFVHGNPKDPCRGVYFHQHPGGRELAICYPNNWESDPGCWPSELQPLNCTATIVASHAQDYPQYSPSPGNRTWAEYYAGLPQRFVDQYCNLSEFPGGQVSRIPDTTFSACLAACEGEGSCVSFQHEWNEYACLPIAGLGMGWEGRCYNSSCVLLGRANSTIARDTSSAARAGNRMVLLNHRCDEGEGWLVTAVSSPVAGKLYYVSPKEFNRTASLSPS